MGNILLFASIDGPYKVESTFNPIALRKAKLVYNFGLSECNRVVYNFGLSE